MEVSRTEVKTACRYLDRAAEHLNRHAVSAKERDQERLLRVLSDKLKMRILRHDISEILTQLNEL